MVAIVDSIVSIGSWFSLLEGVTVLLLLLVLGTGVENPLSLLPDALKIGLDLPLTFVVSMLWYCFTHGSVLKDELLPCPLHNIAFCLLIFKLILSGDASNLVESGIRDSSSASSAAPFPLAWLQVAWAVAKSDFVIMLDYLELDTLMRTSMWWSTF